jgi:glycosyltransferase involved in cell wall biosynthesis
MSPADHFPPDDDPPPPLRVAHVVGSLDCGGVEQVVLHLAREARACGIEMTVVCTVRRGVLAERAESHGAAVVCLNKRPGPRWSVISQLRQVLVDRRIDVVHAHQIGTLLAAGLAARWAAVRAVLHTEHGKHYADRPRMRWLGRLAGLQAGRFCCVSGDMAAEVKRYRIVPQRKLRVIPNGIDTGPLPAARANPAAAAALRRALAIPPGAIVIGTIGRLHEVKRHEVLLRAFALLPPANPQPHLLIVGDGPRLRELRSMASELEIAERVHFPGFQSTPQTYLDLMDIFALTSRSEGHPLVVLEAGLTGLPIVAARVGGIPEMIDDGQDGLLFPAADHAAAAAHLGRLLVDSSLRQALGHSAWARVLRTGGSRDMATAYLREYLSLLAAP